MTHGRAEVSYQMPQAASLYARQRSFSISAKGQDSSREAGARLQVLGPRGTNEGQDGNGGDGKTGGNSGGPSCTPDYTGPVDFGNVPYQDNGEPNGFRLVASGTTCVGALATGDVRFAGRDADLFRIGRSTACPSTLPPRSSRCFIEVLLYATRSVPSVSASLIIPGVGTPDREIPLRGGIGPSPARRPGCSPGASCP